MPYQHLDCNIPHMRQVPDALWSTKLIEIQYLAQGHKHAGRCGAQTQNIDGLVIMTGRCHGGGGEGGQKPPKDFKKGKKLKKYGVFSVFSCIKVIKMSFSVIFNEEIRALEGLLSRF